MGTGSWSEIGGESSEKPSAAFEERFMCLFCETGNTSTCTQQGKRGGHSLLEAKIGSKPPVSKRRCVEKRRSSSPRRHAATTNEQKGGADIGRGVLTKRLLSTQLANSDPVKEDKE